MSLSKRHSLCTLIAIVRVLQPSIVAHHSSVSLSTRNFFLWSLSCAAADAPGSPPPWAGARALACGSSPGGQGKRLAPPHTRPSLSICSLSTAVGRRRRRHRINRCRVCRPWRWRSWQSTWRGALPPPPRPRGLHTSTFRLTLSAFCGIGLHLGLVEGVFRWCQGVLGDLGFRV